MNWFGDTREYYGERWFKGMELAYPDMWRRFDSAVASATLVKRTPTPDRVAVILSGGGSDGPWIPGYVCEGLADAGVIGAPYSAPNAYAIYLVAKELGKNKGVLLMYNNFMGDYLNNDMAAELLCLEGYDVDVIPICDDMGMAIGESRENRGGRIAVAYMTKLAAAAAKRGQSLAQIGALVRKASNRASTLCACVDVERNTVTYGNGFSGEPGFQVKTDTSLEETAVEMIRLLTEELSPAPGERAYLMVNRMYLTSYADSYIMAGYLHKALSQRMPVQQMRVGAYTNILDHYGFTVTLLCADDEIGGYLDGKVCGDSYML